MAYHALFDKDTIYCNIISSSLMSICVPSLKNSLTTGELVLISEVEIKSYLIKKVAQLIVTTIIINL